MASPTTTGGNPISALRMTITASRPGNRVSATAAPNGTPMSPPKTTADKLTMSDNRTIASNAGSPVGEQQLKRRNVVRHGGLHLVGGMLHSGKKSSIFVAGSYSCMAVHMQDLLTTDEAATYLRLSKRKLYELVANGAVPCTKVTGKWLFPKAGLDRWLAAGLLAPALAHAPAPPIVGGSHDPLLEWALRESDSGLASLPEGSEAGLRRLARGEVTAAAIHMHRLDGDDEVANCDAVASAAGLHDAVVIAIARREQGLVVAAGNPLQLSDVAGIAAKRARLALRPQ